MNSLFREYFPIEEPEGPIQSLAPFFSGYQALRDQLMQMLTDDNLGFRAGGENPTLGALCREIGEIERSYIESFKTFRLDFGYRNPIRGWRLASPHCHPGSLSSMVS